jgi:hypothetical protein
MLNLLNIAEYRLPRDLAGFEPVTICLQHFKMPRELGGSSETSLCWTQACPSPSFRIGFRVDDKGMLVFVDLVLKLNPLFFISL